MPATSSSAASSTARIDPKSTLRRSMLLPFIETMSTPRASEVR